MKSETRTRSTWIKIRVSAEEKDAIKKLAHASGYTVADFIRQRALHYRLRQSATEKELVRHMARVSSNMNQIARWANTYKQRAEACEVLFALNNIEEEIYALPEKIRADLSSHVHKSI